MICAHCKKPLSLVESNRPDVDEVYGGPIDVYECLTHWCGSGFKTRVFVPHINPHEGDPDGTRAARGITNGLLIGAMLLITVAILIWG